MFVFNNYFYLLLTLITFVNGFTEECTHINDITTNAAHTIICSKLYHGIAAITMANPIYPAQAIAAAPCRTPCYLYNQCPLAKKCLTVDGICVFSNADLRAGASAGGCPGTAFAMNYICLPLKSFIDDTCYGLLGSACYSEDFRADKKPVYWKKVGPGTLSVDSAHIVHKDRMRYNADGAKAVSGKPNAGLIMVVTAPAAAAWENYFVTANFFVNKPERVFRAATNEMVGVTFRHSGDYLRGKHYMAGWRGAGNGEKSVVGLYEWTNNAYRVLSSSFAAPMPGNIWFSMIVRVVDNKVTVFTNRDPVAEYVQGCSRNVSSDNDPIYCNSNMIAIEYTIPSTLVTKTGTAGLYFAGGTGLTDDFAVRKLAKGGVCGDGICEPENDEDCINCSSDCHPPCGCGDGVCWEDSEAMGCRKDCGACVVKYRIASGAWKVRPDNVAALWSFNNASNIGKDDSQNGMDLIAYGREHQETTQYPCAPGAERPKYGQDKNRCAATSPSAYFELSDIRRAFQRLPVHSCSMTIALFAKMTSQEKLDERSSIVRWGATSQLKQGLTLNIRASYGTRASDGSVEWNFGNHKHRVAVDWLKAGMRHLVFVYDSSQTQTTIYIDGKPNGPKSTCEGSSVSVNQMVTYGRLEVGAFRGYIDDLKILSVPWTVMQMQVDLTGGETMRVPSDIGDQLQAQLSPTPKPAAPTPFPSVVTESTSLMTTIQTRRPQFVGPTPPVRTCIQLCIDRCAKEGKEYISCQCYDLYSDPGDQYSCDAPHIHAIYSLLSCLLVAFMLV